MGKRRRLTKKSKEMVGETDSSSPQSLSQPNITPLLSQSVYATRQSKLVTNNQCSSSTPLNKDAVSAQNQCTCENDSAHSAQDSGAALKNLFDTTGHKRGIPATSVSVCTNLLETKVAQSCPTKGKRGAEELTAESPLQNKVSCPSGAMTINSSSHVEKRNSDSSPSESWSKMFPCNNRSEEVQRSIPMDLSEIHVPQTEDNVTHNANSFNLTEAVENMHNILHDNDDEEFESSINPTLVNVQGYCVRQEMAPLLSKILNEHGDIASNCKVKVLRGYFLEIVCSLFQKLQNTSFGTIKSSELKEMTDVVNELQKMGVNVTWLSKRLDDISSTIDFLKMYSAMKKKEHEMKESIDIKENELKHNAAKLVTLQNIMSTIQQKNHAVEEEVVKMKVEAEKIHVLRQKATTYLNNCLVDGLI